MVANLESNEIMSDSSHGDHRHSSDDRHESNHEFNMFLDREIQKSLLGISDKLADNDARGINIFLGAGNIRTKAKARQSKYEDFCAWTEPWNVQAEKKIEKSSGKLSRDKDSSSNLWKDFKPKQIHYIFRHYSDAKRYIEQYRYEHTYNFGPLSREPIEITTCKIVPIQETPSPSHRTISQRSHHNPFRRIKPSPSHPNLAGNGIDLPGESLKHAKSEPNIEDIVQSCINASSPNVFKEPVSTPKQSNGQHHCKSPDSEENSLPSHVSYNALSRPSSSKSVKQNRPTSPWVSPNGKRRSPTRSDKTIQATSVSLDTVSKLSPLQVLQVKTKGASAIHAGALPLFQGKTMKVVSTGATTQNNNSEAINMTGKVHSSKVAPLVTNTNLQAPNVKTLDMLSQMHAPETHQGERQESQDSNQQSEGKSDEQQSTKKSGSVSVKDSTAVNEASQNLKQGTDKEHYQTLVSELSYLDISTSDNKTTKDLEMEHKHQFDVTGLTMSFAQKYEIRELGFSNVDETVDAVELTLCEDYGSEDVVNGSNDSEDGSKAKEINSNLSKSNGSEQKTQVHLEKVSKNRVTELKKEEIQKIKEIKTRMSRKKDMQMHKIGQVKESKSYGTKTEKSEVTSTRDNKVKDTLPERQKSRVTFRINPEVIDVEEDTELVPVQYQHTLNERREVSSPEAVKPATMFPHLNSSDRMASTTGKRHDKTRSPVKRLREPSPDKTSIMRRYFMDIAEREGDDQLLARLQQAPDHSFKPASAGDATDKIHHTKHWHSMDDARVSYEEKPHSSPCGTYVYASTPQPKAALQNYSRLAPAKVATRQKSFYNTRTNAAAESDKRFLKDLSKLSKLKEIYMKTREKSEANIKGKYKPNTTVLHKIQAGNAETEGVDMLEDRTAVVNPECSWSVVAGYCL